MKYCYMAISRIPAYKLETEKEFWPSNQADKDPFFFLSSGMQLHF